MRYFTRNDEWIDIDGSRGRVGVTSEGAKNLGEVSFVELPEIGRAIARGEAICTIETVKAAVDIFAPMSGTVLEVNAELAASPQLLGDAADGTWIAEIEVGDPAETAGLLDAAAYKALYSE